MMILSFQIIVWVICLKLGVYDLIKEIYNEKMNIDVVRKKSFTIEQMKTINFLKDLDDKRLRYVYILIWTSGFLVYSAMLAKSLLEF